jgi:hypothetical protein
MQATDEVTSGFGGLIDASISSGALSMDTGTRGGWAEIEGFSDDDYMIQFTPDLTNGTFVDAFFRVTDLYPLGPEYASWNSAKSKRSTSLSASRSKSSQPNGWGPPAGPVMQPSHSAKSDRSTSPSPS